MADGSPWGGDALSVKDPEERLSKEIHNFIEYIAPTSKETRLREDAIEAISDTVKNLWPSAEVQVYGSFKTSLVLPSSDVDLCVKTVEALQPRKAKNYLFQLRNALTRRNLTTDTMVPILVTKMLKSRIAADQADKKQELIGQKLLGFLSFWAEFNFSEKGFYLADGGGYFDKKDKPDDSPLHAPKVVVIEDPNSKDVNVGRATSQLEGVKEGFKKAYRLLKDRIDSAQDDSILSAFILLPKSINDVRPVGTDYNLEDLEDMRNPVDLGSTRDAVRKALSKSRNHKRKRGAFDDDQSGQKRQRAKPAYKGNRKNFRN
ncbi:hypothetical protein NQZ79_g6912 [Umbelopsis isabellina]|nr:hypothetical protein NQZ79_g6912 [Umbelopsis isabellina]